MPNLTLCLKIDACDLFDFWGLSFVVSPTGHVERSETSRV